MLTLMNLVIAFSVTALCILLLSPLTKRLGLVDKPGGRKQHQGEVPLLGGIAMCIGFAFTILTLNISLLPYRSLFAGCGLLVFIGVLDDFHELPAKARLLGQIMAAFLMCLWGQNSLHNLGNLIFEGNILLRVASIPFTIFATVGMINALNMTDGIDGLAGSLAFTQLLLLAWIAWSSHLLADLRIILVLCATIVAFLWHNLPRRKPHSKRIFMGDAGSMMLGFVLSWYTISLSQGAHPAVTPVTMLWILALPLFDFAVVMIIRKKRGMSLLAPSRDHFHHRLLAMGFSELMIVLTGVGLTLAFGCMGILGMHFYLPQGMMFIGFLLAFILYAQWALSLARQQQKKSLAVAS